MNGQQRLTFANDQLIELLIDDPLYKIEEAGYVMTLITKTGKISTKNIWRIAGSVQTNKTYSKTKYVQIRYKEKKISVHRVIYRKFKGHLDCTLTINHIDGNGLNNHIDNLEQVSASENMRHRYRTLKYPAPKGHAKITQQMAESIRSEYSCGSNYKTICLKYGLSKGNVSAIVNQQTWKGEPK